MEVYAEILMIIIPIFYLLIIIEAVYAYSKKKFNFRSMDTISSLSSGTTNAIKDLLGLTIIIISYDWVLERVALFEIKNDWLVYILAFIALDFANYWIHRLDHSINFFWNEHVVHHSSEEFNLAVALRQSISTFFNLSFIFMLPAALLGISTEVIAVVTPLHLFAQFWYHTEHIGKLGWLEYIIVTPSQHRVHHALNPIYLDKNLSPVFCIWDRLFGTFQEELEEEPCVFGVTRQVNTWNPIKINFQHLLLLIKDAWRTNNWLDKLRIWFMPTGWRPADVIEKYPVISAKAKAFIKYNPPASPALRMWSWLQFGALHVLFFYFLFHFGQLSQTAIFLYGTFLFIVIYSYTELMDRNPNAMWMELFKSLIALGIIYQMDGWFDVDSYLPNGTLLVIAYMVLSSLMTFYFVYFEMEEEILLAK
jgi:sterol desaturase/sphingolipid hydroxylase (fatty acid hydroxylase superfamily)